MKKLLRTFMLAVLFLPFALQAQTECSSLSIPYAENFDAYTGNATSTTAPTGYPAITLPDCWTFLNMSESTSTYPQAFLTSSSTYAVSGNCLFFKSSSTTPLYAIMPSVGDQTGAWQLSFQYRNEGTSASNGTIIVGTMTDVTDASTFVTLQILERTTTKTLMEIIIPAGTVTNGARLAFCYEGGTSNNYYASIDNVTLDVAPTCVKVTSLAIDETLTSPNSLTMTWTDALNIGATYSVYDMSDTTFITGGINDYTYTVTGLAANTAYTFGIQTDCGGGDIADGYVTVSGRTACAAQALPWTCGFEADEIVSTSSLTALPWCSERYTSAYTSTTHYPYSYSSTTYAHDGSRVLYFYGGTGTTYPDTMALILPEIDVNTYPMNANRMTFWARSSSTSYDKTLYVYTLSNATDINSATLIDSVVVTGTTHVKYSVSLANAPATDAYVVLMATKANGYLILDDLTLEVAPSCPDITGLAVTAVTSSSITLSWNPAEGVNGYTIYDADDEFIATTTETTYTIENLDANTNYTFGLQSNCSAGDGSVSTVSGRTSCEAESIPFTETFDATLASDPCWRGATGTTAAEVFNGATLTLSGISAGYWNYSSSQNGFNDGHYYCNIYGTSRKSWMITPAIDLSTATTAQLSFDMALTAYSGTMQAPAAYTGGQKFMVIVSTDGGNTWLESNATVWMRADSNANYAFEDIPYDHYGNYIINLNQYLGNTIKIAFYGESTVTGGDNNFHIDNIAVTEVPSCPSVMGLTLDGKTATTASIHWNDNGSTGYEVEVRQNDVALTDVTVVVTDTTAEISGLAVDNDYQIAVRSICGSDYGQWCSALNIHIGYCTPNPTSVDNNGITSVSFGGMTNTTHPTSASYADYTSMSGTVPAGLPATVEITYATGYTYGTIIWVDWNNSMSFEGNEVVYAGTSASTNPTTLAATFDVPATMQQGSYRMRIVGADMAFDSYTSSIAAAANANPCATYSYGVAEDYTLIVGEAPSCLPVSNLTVSDITSNGATLTWTGSSADSYSVIDLSDSSVVATVSTETYNLTNLDPMTHYTIGVVANCGSNQSLMVTVSFNTACTAVDLPYTETFASTSSTRDCWNLVSMNTANDVGTSNGMGFMTVNGHDVLRFSSYSSATDYNQYGFSPLMNVSSSATNLMVNVVYATYGTDDFLYFGYITPTDTVWEPTAYQTASNSGASTWETATLIIPANATQVAIHYYGSYAYYGWIDTVNVIEMTGDYCYAVTNLTADNSTTSSISLSWSDNNNTGATYTVYNMADNTVIATGVSGNSYVVTGLTASTSYTFGVVANCSATSEADIVTVNAMTDCADITTLPYNEGFENGLGCWMTINASSDGQPWTVNNCSGLSNVNPHGGAYVASSWSWSNSAMHANAWLISPKFVLPTTVSEGLVLSWWDITNASYPDKYSVLVSTTTNDTAAFTTVVRPYGPASGSWAQRNVDLTAYAGQEIYIAFHHEDYDMNYLLVDDISLFDGTPIAPVEDSLTVIITVNDPVMGTTLPAPGTHHYAASETVELLAVPNNGYHFEGWLWELEGEVDTLDADYISLSFPAGVFMDNETMTFTALFAAGNPDSTTVTYAVNDATMGSITPAPGTYTIYVGNNITAVATPNAGYELDAWMLNFYSGTTLVGSDTIFSTNDQFDNPMSFGTLPQSFVDLGVTISVTAIFAALPVSEYTVTLNTADATMGSVSPAGANLVAAGSSFTATATANAGYHFTAWMSGNLQISTANPYTFDVTGNITLTAIFEADPVEPCDAPTNVVATNVTDHSITLSWTDNADAYSWNIGWQWGGAYLAGPITISNNPYTIENLQPNTSYTIHLQSICAGVGESDWVDITVTTLGTGINDLLSNNVTLFPNPAREYVDIRIDGNANVTAMEVFDVYGKLINTVNVIDNPTRINVNGLADGMYFVRVTTDNGTVTKTFVKK